MIGNPPVFCWVSTGNISGAASLGNIMGKSLGCITGQIINGQQLPRNVDSIYFIKNFQLTTKRCEWSQYVVRCAKPNSYSTPKPQQNPPKFVLSLFHNIAQVFLCIKEISKMIMILQKPAPPKAKKWIKELFPLVGGKKVFLKNYLLSSAEFSSIDIYFTYFWG